MINNGCVAFNGAIDTEIATIPGIRDLSIFEDLDGHFHSVQGAASIF
jgi:hypothetical protein